MTVDDPHRPRALVVDDNASVCAALCELLWTVGFEAKGAISGTEALALFDQRAFDLVTTDLRMPGLTGWEVVEAVRSRAPTIRVLLITGLATDLDKDRARAMNVVVLPKPLRLDDLRRAVESGRSSTKAP